MNTQPKPQVSIIVPVYNGEATIGRCVESLVSQEYPQEFYEVIVVDNNSTDSTREIIQRYPVKILTETEVQSSYAARNRGVKASQGEFLAFTDADCIAHPNWLNRAVVAFKDEGVGCVAGTIRSSAPTNPVEAYLVKNSFPSQEGSLNNVFLPAVATANAIYRRNVFKRIGMFDTNFKSGGDDDFAWRMQLKTPYRINYVPEAVVYHCHRTTAWAYFKQRKNYGLGDAALYRKYHGLMKGRTLRASYWGYRLVLGRANQWLRIWIKAKLGRELEVSPPEAFLDFLGSAGQKIGQLHGSLVYRVWYL